MTTNDQDCRAWFEQGKKLPSPDKQYNYFSAGFRKGEQYQPWAWIGVGLVWLEQGKTDAAETAFEKAIEISPQFSELIERYKKKSKSEKETKRREETASNTSIEKTTKMIKRYKNASRSDTKETGNESLNSQDIRGGTKAFLGDIVNSGIQYAPENKDEIALFSAELSVLPVASQLKLKMLLYLATKYSRGGNHAEAQKILREVVEIHPKFSYAWRILAFTCLELEKFQEAEEYARKAVSLAPNHFIHWLSLGHLLEDQKKDEDASKAYQKAIDLDPGEAIAWLSMAYLSLYQDRTDDALVMVRKGLNVARDKSSLFFLLGEIFSERKEYADSEIALKNGLQIFPDDSCAWQSLGVALYEQHKFSEAENALKKSIELDKNRPKPWCWLGRVYEEMGRYQKAEESYLEATRLEPDSEEGWLLLQENYRAQKRERDADRAHAKVLEIRKSSASPESSEDLIHQTQDLVRNIKERLSKDAATLKEILPANFLQNLDLATESVPFEVKARPFLDAGNQNAAIKVFQEALEQHPKNDILWGDLGSIWLEMHKYEKAIDAYKRACDLNPNEISHWDKLGICEMSLNHYENAIPIYKKMLELDPKLLRCWDPIGQAYQFLGKFREAAEAYEKFIEYNSTNVGVWTNLGIVREELGDLRGAEAAQLKAIEIDPNFARAWNNLAVTYTNAKDYVKAEQAARKAIAINPRYIQACTNLCSALIYQKRYSEAEAECLKAIEINPQEWGLWHNLSQIRSLLGKFTEGVVASEKALQLNPQDIDSLIGLAVCKECLGDHEGAEITYQKAIKMSPSNPIAYLNLGTMYMKIARLQDAIELFQTVTRVIPTLAIAWVQLGEAYLKNQNVSDAKSAFRKARELAPKDLYIEKRIAWAEQFIRGDNTSTPFIERPHTESEQEEGVEEVSYTVQLDPESPEKNRCTRKNEDPFITMTLNNPRQSPIDKTGVLETEERKTERARQDAQIIESWVKKGFSAQKSRDLKGAAFAFRKVIELGPWVFMQYQNLASVYFEMNQPHDAVEVYQKLTRSFPGHALAWVQLGEAYLADHKVQDARSAFRRAKELAPSNSYLKKRMAWSEQFIKNEEVLPSYNVFSREESLDGLVSEFVDWPSFYKPESSEKKQIYILQSFYEAFFPPARLYGASQQKEKPSPHTEDSPKRLKREADEYYAHGKINQARDAYLDYLKHVPNDAEVWCRLGEMSLDAGKRQRAEREFQECLKHDPKNAHAKDRLDQLKRSREIKK